MTAFTIRALDADTWEAFADLVERNNGVWSGCWCMGFHPEGFSGDPRTNKEARVREGRAHAALVFEGDECVGWCQFGSPEELTRIKLKRAYDADAGPTPDWRITCFFTGKGHRKKGVSAAALKGALVEIARLGGGVVESMPEDVVGRRVSGSFLHNATLALFEEAGFARVRRLGKDRWLVSKKVRARRD